MVQQTAKRRDAVRKDGCGSSSPSHPSVTVIIPLSQQEVGCELECDASTPPPDSPVTFSRQMRAGLVIRLWDSTLLMLSFLSFFPSSSSSSVCSAEGRLALPVGAMSVHFSLCSPVPPTAPPNTKQEGGCCTLKQLWRHTWEKIKQAEKSGFKIRSTPLQDLYSVASLPCCRATHLHS